MASTELWWGREAGYKEEEKERGGALGQEVLSQELRLQQLFKYCK